MELIWSEEDRLYFTVPDGDIATHEQIHEYYNKKDNTILDNTILYVDGETICSVEKHIPYLY